MSGSAELCFPEDHPTAPGHFPGNPIVPGALLLDRIVLTISGGASAHAITVRGAKFLRPVRPGDRLHLEWERKGIDTHFSCSFASSGEIATSGILRLGDDAE